MRYLDSPGPSEQGYTIVDGVIEDVVPVKHTNQRRAYLTYEQRRAQWLAEEAQWAARSGPVRIIHPGRTAQ